MLDKLFDFETGTVRLNGCPDTLAKYYTAINLRRILLYAHLLRQAGGQSRG